SVHGYEGESRPREFDTCVPLKRAERAGVRGDGSFIPFGSLPDPRFAKLWLNDPRGEDCRSAELNGQIAESDSTNCRGWALYDRSSPTNIGRWGLSRRDGLNILILSLLPLVRRRNRWYLGFGGFTGCPPRRCGLLDPYDFSMSPPCPVTTLFLKGTGQVGGHKWCFGGDAGKARSLF
ncbi:hypothetical protein U1Q18_000819, partial [Sarracenia purpurea var. burkii]